MSSSLFSPPPTAIVVLIISILYPDNMNTNETSSKMQMAFPPRGVRKENQTETHVNHRISPVVNGWLQRAETRKLLR